MWTHFWDMHSGGGAKEKWSQIYIEAPREEAEVIFYNKFGHNPNRVTCTCCGEDYSIYEEEDFAQLTGYHRGCDYYGPPRGKDNLWKEHIKQGRYFEPDETPPKSWVSALEMVLTPKIYYSVKDFKKKEEVLVIPASEIKDEWRKGEVPEQGYVWIDG